MRILHTADWHLGLRNGRRIDRSADLRRSVESIFALCQSERVDVLLIAGDLFDEVCRQDDVCSAIEHLKEAARPFLSGGGTILAITGNHDGEVFSKTLQHTLALVDPGDPRAGDRLLPGRFHLFTRPAFHHMVDVDGSKIQFVLMPYPLASRYLDADVTPYSGGEGKYRRLRELFSDTLHRIRKHEKFDLARHSVLVAHLFLQGATLPNGHTITPDDERSDVVCPAEDLGAGWAYVALGHVHKPQMLGGRSNVRYCGGIERFDFGERENETGTILLDIGPEGLRDEPTWLPLVASTFLEVVIKDPEADLAELESRYPDPSEALVKCRVTYRAGEDDPDSIHRRIDRLFPRCYERAVEPLREEVSGEALAPSAFSDRTPLENVMAYLKSRLVPEDPLTPAVLAEAESLLEEIER